MLYGDEFDMTEVPVQNQIVYASAWSKGIQHIISLFRYIVTIDAEIKLALLSPGYDHDRFVEFANEIKEEFGERIIIHGPLNKREYSRVLKSSLCTLSPRYPETFGCVFAESYYLGVPVIADVHSGAVCEIIDNDYIVNYDQPENVYTKIQSLKTRPTIRLDEKFLTSIREWDKL